MNKRKRDEFSVHTMACEPLAEQVPVDADLNAYEQLQARAGELNSFDDEGNQTRQLLRRRGGKCAAVLCWSSRGQGQCTMSSDPQRFVETELCRRGVCNTPVPANVIADRLLTLFSILWTQLNINATPSHLLQKLAFVWGRGVIVFDNYRGEEHMWIRVGRKNEVEFEHVGPMFIFKSPGKSRSEAQKLFSQAMRMFEPARGQLSGPGLDTAATLYFRVSDA